jgi:hypothetical protein
MVAGVAGVMCHSRSSPTSLPPLLKLGSRSWCIGCIWLVIGDSKLCRISLGLTPSIREVLYSLIGLHHVPNERKLFFKSPFPNYPVSDSPVGSVHY